MLENQSVKNEKPQAKGATSAQGIMSDKGNSNSTPFAESKAREELNGSKSRYEKGMELYKQGKVSITGDGMFKVSGFYHVDTGKMKCECPDYKNNRRPCKHIFACLLFVKNRGKQRIEHLSGSGNDKNANDSPETHSKLETKTETNHRNYDKQRIITRLACLNTAVEVLKTQGDPIQREELFETARQLEQWALGELE